MLNRIFISTMSEICGYNIGRCCDAILFDDKCEFENKSFYNFKSN